MTFGRATPKLNAAKGAGQRCSTFYDRNNEAEAIERMRNVLAPVAQIDRGGRSIRYRIEFRGEFCVHLTQQIRRRVSRKRKTNSISADNFIRTRANLPLPRFFIESKGLGFRVQTNRNIFQSRDERINKHAHPIVKREKEAVSCAARPLCFTL